MKKKKVKKKKKGEEKKKTSPTTSNQVTTISDARALFQKIRQKIQSANTKKQIMMAVEKAAKIATSATKPHILRVAKEEYMKIRREASKRLRNIGVKSELPKTKELIKAFSERVRAQSKVVRERAEVKPAEVKPIKLLNPTRSLVSVKNKPKPLHTLQHAYGTLLEGVAYFVRYPRTDVKHRELAIQYLNYAARQFAKHGKTDMAKKIREAIEWMKEVNAGRRPKGSPELLKNLYRPSGIYQMSSWSKSEAERKALQAMKKGLEYYGKGNYREAAGYLRTAIGYATLAKNEGLWSAAQYNYQITLDKMLGTK